MADYDAYKIESDSQLTDTTIYFADSIRIIPLGKEGLVKNEPNAKDFSTALKMLLPEGLEDAGLADNDKSLREKVLAKIPDIYASFYIDPEEALFLLTGTRPSLAAYRFKWKGRVYFTMRPDYGLHYILSTVECEPINCFESEIRNRLLGLKKEINSIEQAIRHRDIIKGLGKGPISQVLESGGFYHFRDTEAPFDEWTQLFQKRGFDLSHIPEKFLCDPLSVLKKEVSVLKNENNKLKDEVNHYQKKLMQHSEDAAAQPKELRIAIEARTALYKRGI